MDHRQLLTNEDGLETKYIPIKDIYPVFTSIAAVPVPSAYGPWYFFKRKYSSLISLYAFKCNYP